MRKLLLAAVGILLHCAVWSQEYSYTHYDIGEGLAGSTVYCITQDKDGFIWVGTETGVSRFDGTHFRNFTTKDGLPDVEILEIFGDSRGRVWMAPFRKSICYYFQGKIYNPDNDSTLRSMVFKGNIEHFAENAAGDVLIQESERLHLVGKNGIVTNIDSINTRPISVHAISRSRDGCFLVQEHDSVYEFNGTTWKFLFAIPSDSELKIPNYIALSPNAIVWRAHLDKGHFQSVSGNRAIDIPFGYTNYRHVSYTIVDDTLAYSNESTGSIEYHLNSGQIRSFLPGMEVSRTFRDDEGSIWFTTISHGLYRLNSIEFRNIDLKQPFSGDCAVYSIKKMNDQLLIGTNRNSIFRFSVPGMKPLGFRKLSDQEKKRIVFIDTLDKGRVIYGTDWSIEIREANGRKILKDFGVVVRAAYLKNTNEVVSAGSLGTYLYQLMPPYGVETLYPERATTVYFRQDTIYVGTLSGLYRITGIQGNRRVAFMGKSIPFLRKRIASIVESAGGILWIASYDDAGIIGIRNDSIVGHIDRQQGLTSDICRTLAIEKNSLWVGTDKGLNKIDLRSADVPIMQYTSNDGLASNVINNIVVDSPMVYVGTPVGLSVFNETKVVSNDYCRLTWLDILSSGKSRINDTSNLLLPYQQSNIHFEFVGISYKSAGNILYRYRLIGLDTNWKTTKETFLDYPTLPSGKYELQIVAINKFGTFSQRISQRFSVSTPFWRTLWFNLAVIVTFLLLTWLGVYFRLRFVRRRQEEEKEMTRRMSEMENMALQAQMNPHFIFNCLNSIQQYIFDQDIFAANKYITGFSRLIRATLHNSTKQFIPLSDEINYLSNYLSLEKLRFKDKMDYSIEVDPAVNTHSLTIPPMLIQPYVENSMRHGLRHKMNGKGYIHISFKKENNRLLVTVADNGIGRKNAARFKTSEHIEYQSKGMSLTADRIRMMNRKYNESIVTHITDLEDSLGQPSGTRVVMEFPLFYTLS